MNGNLFKQAVCVVLALMMFGCKSTYDLRLYSTPSGVAVEVSPDINGRTPCKLEIPKKSELIYDHHIDVKYTLDDGREFLKSYDLRNYETPGPDIGGFIGDCIAVPGIILLAMLSSDKDDDDKDYSKTPLFYAHEKETRKEIERKEEKERETKAKAGLVGVGLAGTGALIKGVFGSKSGKRDKYDIYESFEEIAALPE